VKTGGGSLFKTLYNLLQTVVRSDSGRIDEQTPVDEKSINAACLLWIKTI